MTYTFGGYHISKQWREIDSRKCLVWVAELINKPNNCFFGNIIGSTLEEVKQIIKAEKTSPLSPRHHG